MAFVHPTSTNERSFRCRARASARASSAGACPPPARLRRGLAIARPEFLAREGGKARHQPHAPPSISSVEPEQRLTDEKVSYHFLDAGVGREAGARLEIRRTVQR